MITVNNLPATDSAKRSDVEVDMDLRGSDLMREVTRVSGLLQGVVRKPNLKVTTTIRHFNRLLTSHSVALSSR